MRAQDNGKEKNNPVASTLMSPRFAAEKDATVVGEDGFGSVV